MTAPPRRHYRITIYPVGCLLWFLLVALVVVILNWLVSR